MLVKQTIRIFWPQISSYVVGREDLVEYLGHPWRVESNIIVCPLCTKLWAILAVEAEEYFQPIAGYCGRCTPSQLDYINIPGSILIDNWGRFDIELLRVLPDELVIREFAYHMVTFSGNKHNRDVLKELESV